MSGKDVGELFGDDGTKARPRTGLVIAVLVTGLTLTVLGMACTAVPGGIVTLVSWALVEREIDRVDSGFLPLQHRPALVAVRGAVWGGLLVVLGLFVIQSILLCNGTYYSLWSAGIEMLRPLASDT
jgi:hypothetical protein